MTQAIKLGVVGAGAIGLTLARVAVRCGHSVMVSNSRGTATLQDAARAAGCAAGTVQDAARFADVVILAIPFRAIGQLSPEWFSAKIVLDANNYYPARDGRLPDLDRHACTTSGMLQAHLGAEARVVKFFNAIMQRDIETDARPHGASPRRALPIAGDNPDAKQVATDLVDQFGFDPVDAGTLEDSWRFERAMPAYCVAHERAGLMAALASAVRGVELPHGSWQKSPRFS